MARLDLDTDALRDAVAVAKQIDQLTATAKNLLNQNIQTADWDVGKLTEINVIYVIIHFSERNYRNAQKLFINDFFDYLEPYS